MSESEKNRRIYTETMNLREHICEICGKKFECRPEYTYKKLSKRNKAIFYCSWTCMRKGEKDDSRTKERSLGSVC